MRRVITSIIGTLCIGSAALAQYPTIAATVTSSGGSVIYSYTLINTTPGDVWQFNVCMPGGASDAITSYATSREGWDTLIRRAAFDMIAWYWTPESAAGASLGPGYSADFSFTTPTGVPTTTSFTEPGSDSNWGWWDGTSGGGGYGNTVLPVPAFVPEPSSLAPLGGGLLTVALSLGRHLRRRT